MTPGPVASSVTLHRAGTGRGTAVLVHGLASAAASWMPFIQALPEGVGYAAVDLPGHGGQPPAQPYSFGDMAVRVGQVCAVADPPVTVVGHSLGGAVALLVGSGLFGAQVAAVVTIGSKVRWTEAERAGAQAVAAKPPKWFESAADAGRFWQRVAGCPPGSPISPELEAQVLATDGSRWRLAYDPAVAGLGEAPLLSLVELCAAPVQLVRGELDPVVSAEDLELDGTRKVLTLQGCGHSPHIEQPVELVTRLGLDGDNPVFRPGPTTRQEALT